MDQSQLDRENYASLRNVPTPREAPEAEVVPVEDLFDFGKDPVDFMSAESFPASDPAPPPSMIAPSFRVEREEEPAR
jgi:hypothetical protein